MEEIINLIKFIEENLFVADGSKLNPKRTNDSYLTKYWPKKLELIYSKTEFLNVDVTVAQRIRTVLQGITSQPTCFCGKYVKFRPETGTYREFCSPYCPDSKKEYIARIEETSYERYGTNVPSKSVEVRKKLQKVADSRTPEWHEMSLLKRQNTCLERYGVKNPMQSAEISYKPSETYEKRTGYSHPSKNPAVQELTRQRSLSKNGVPYPNQVQLSDKMKSMVLNEAHFKRYLRKAHFEENKTLTEISIELDSSPYLISDYFHKFELPVQGFQRSISEKEVAEHVTLCVKGENVLLNSRALLFPLELDIYVKKLRVAVEYNGVYWHSYGSIETLEQKNKHATKTSDCKKVGVQLYTIFENEWADPVKKEIWKSILSIKLGATSFDRIFARKCIIKRVSVKCSRKFYDTNHLQGFSSASVHLGLYHGDVLTSMMSFRKCKDSYELVRFCSSLGIVIVGGASKLFTHFKRNFKFSSIVTFADLRYTDGGIYRVLGFCEDSKVPPRYSYVKNGKLFHRRGFQKQYLKKMLGNLYDDSMTESELIFTFTNYRRIWDCGKIKFIHT